MDLKTDLEYLGLTVVDTGSGHWSVVNRRQIACYWENITGFHGWCQTWNGRTDYTSAAELLGAIKAVI